ncbi:DinB family protein [Winogradskyella litoriviva]|uniref:DinB family protein n=1 Tax=Winogradskyella litoriviva TaxID=1220182 RepID=A0ABX2E686_9FLAO|nr:DinB family protein [Winogradskyella litoriviva]NRD23511.1 DinB family protein [Winogradskyella litoriviva]
MKLNVNEYNSYYESYIEKSNQKPIVEGLSDNLERIVLFFRAIPKGKQDYSYAEGKWTIKDILLHIIDTERIFSYRALRISRNDKTPLPGFEHNDYVFNASASNRSLESLLEEYTAVRKATIALYNSLNPPVLLEIGEASGFPISVRAIGYIITGHENHHCEIIKQRYL